METLVSPRCFLGFPWRMKTFVKKPHPGTMAGELHSFYQRGAVARINGAGSYSPELSNYWSSSSRFAIWWAGMIAIKDKAASEVFN